MPKASPKGLDAESNHESNRVLPASGPVPEGDSVIEKVADMSTVGDKAKNLAFMEEPVEIIISESSDPNAERHVFVSVNGQGAGPKGVPWLTRGVPYIVRRKFVEVLAKAKTVRVRTDETMDSRGDRTMDIKKSSALAYQFQVISDKNPEGISWLRRVLAQA